MIRVHVEAERNLRSVVEDNRKIEQENRTGGAVYG